jgi:hypothetical protein
MLKFNVMCVTGNHSHEITYVNDDTCDKRDEIVKWLKKGSADRILFIDFGVMIDENSLKRVFDKNDILVFPAATPGIDWDMFARKVKDGTDEPLHQAGLEFDTEVGDEIGDGMYMVKRTDPKAWVMTPKIVSKAIKPAKGVGITLPARMSDIFEKFCSSNLKVNAYTKAEVTVTYTHECLSNIPQSCGVRVI